MSCKMEPAAPDHEFDALCTVPCSPVIHLERAEYFKGGLEKDHDVYQRPTYLVFEIYPTEIRFSTIAKNL